MADAIDAALAEYNRATDDFTALGRWGWGLAITFGLGALFQSAGKEIIGPDDTDKKWELAILLLFACAAYARYLHGAWRNVVSVRDALDKLPADPRRDWALANYRDETQRYHFLLRLGAIVVALGVGVSMILVDPDHKDQTQKVELRCRAGSPADAAKDVAPLGCEFSLRAPKKGG